MSDPPATFQPLLSGSMLGARSSLRAGWTPGPAPQGSATACPGRQLGTEGGGEHLGVQMAGFHRLFLPGGCAQLEPS